MVTGSQLSIITLKVYGLTIPAKGQRLAKWTHKQDPYICYLQETYLKHRDTYRLKVRGWKKIFHANGDQKKAGVEILTSDKIDFEIKTITYSPDYCTQQRSHSDMKEKPKALQTSKS